MTRLAAPMEEVRKVVLIEFTPAQMFDLVENIEAYPEYLPWCSAAEVFSRTATHTSARIHASYHGMGASIATENDNERPAKITLRLREGPFRRFEGEWSFSPLGDSACKVELRICYEFASRIVGKAIEPVFNHISNSLVDAFIKRAEKVYGSRHD